MRSAQQSFKDELESLQYENEATVSSLLKRRTECQVASNSYYEMTSQLDHYQQRCQDIKRHLEDVKKITVAKETDAKDVEKFVSDHTKELIEAEKYLEKFKHQIFRESQLVIELRHGETNLMAEIRSAYVSILSRPNGFFALLRHDLLYPFTFFRSFFYTLPRVKISLWRKT